jgi:glycosyltransferase involved in cell wall biosynthesis
VTTQVSAAPLAASRPSRPWNLIAGSVVSGFALARRVASLVGGPPRPAPDGYDVLLTATFHSDNWIRAHLAPLAASARCRSVRMVALVPTPSLPKVEALLPPVWLRRTIGGVPARLALFAWTALRTRPHVVGGFHLLLNGLVAAPLARLVRARSLYFCVGGRAEVEDGGLRSENRLFTRIGGPSPSLESALLRALQAFDLLVTMGRGALAWFRDRGVRAPASVNGGGIDPSRFAADGAAPEPIDVVYVGRLAPIKRPDVFVRTMARLAEGRPSLRAAVVGDGELRAEREALARELGVGERITFAGLQRDVGPWLGRSRVLALTSDSEGLPLSVMEATLCGLPAVVSDVGDLAELVEDGVNGYRVPAGDVEAFARAIGGLLDDPSRHAAFAAAARAAARRHDLDAARARWDGIFAAWDAGRLPGEPA